MNSFCSWVNLFSMTMPVWKNNYTFEIILSSEVYCLHFSSEWRYIFVYSDRFKTFLFIKFIHVSQKLPVEFECFSNKQCCLRHMWMFHIFLTQQKFAFYWIWCHGLAYFPTCLILSNASLSICSLQSVWSVCFYQ